jgi:hypothetical protein
MVDKNPSKPNYKTRRIAQDKRIVQNRDMSTVPLIGQFTISFPEDLAQKVDQLARQENHKMNAKVRTLRLLWQP